MQVADRLRRDLPIGVVVFFVAAPLGLGIALAVAVVVILRRNDLNSHSFHVELRDEPGSKHRVRIRFAQQVTFLSRGAILQEFCEIPDGSHVVIDLSRTRSIDPDVLEILHDFKSSAESRDRIVDTIDYSDEPVAISRRGSAAILPASASQPSEQWSHG